MLKELSSLEVEPLLPSPLVPGMLLNDRYISAANRVMDAVSAKMPEFVGMTVFGSLSRGEASVKEDGSVSDIDGVVVVDVAGNSDLADFADLPDWKSSYPVLGKTMLGMEMKVGLQNLIDRVAATNAQSDLDILLVSNRQLFDIPRGLLSAAVEPEAQVEDWTKVDDTVMAALRYFIGRNQPAGLFFPVIYGDLEGYRTRALQPIAEFRQDKPQITARIWENIRVYTNHYRKGRHNDNEVVSDLPVNVDEAIQEFKAA